MNQTEAGHGHVYFKILLRSGFRSTSPMFLALYNYRQKYTLYVYTIILYENTLLFATKIQ